MSPPPRTWKGCSLPPEEAVPGVGTPLSQWPSAYTLGTSVVTHPEAPGLNQGKLPSRAELPMGALLTALLHPEPEASVPTRPG